MTDSSRRTKAWLLAGAATCLLAGAAVFPPVAAQATWDGLAESLPGEPAVWIVASLLLLSAGGGMIAAHAAWLAGRRPHRGVARGRLAAGAAAGACVLALAAVTGFGLYRRQRNHVDLPARLDPNHPLADQVGAIASARGRTAGLDQLAEHFRTRRPPDVIKPVQLWRPAQELRTRASHVEAGTSTDLPGFHWRPGRPIEWRCPGRSQRRALLFALQRQTFLFDLLADPDGADGHRQIELAGAFARQWRQDNPVWPNANRYAWNDDATANRLQAHIHLMRCARRLGATTRRQELDFLESMLQHTDRLMDPAEYNPRTNHGMMQNCALLSAALAYPQFDRDGRWRRTAVRRMEQYLLDYAVSDEGVFLELTPGYHLMASGRALWFYASCRQAGVELDGRFAPLVRKMLAFCLELLQPDRSLPMIADTAPIIVDVSGWPWEQLPDWPELARLRAGAAPSPRPPNAPTARLYPQSGYFLLRAPAEEWTTSQAMMLTLRVGPISNAHRHYDALAVTLFARGRGLLAGPGYPPYDQSRARLIATTSQNTVSVDGRSQRAGGARTLFCDVRPRDGAPDFVAITGRSELYDGVRHDRAVLYGPSARAVMIVDHLTSRERHTYRQHFRPAPSLTAEAAEDGLAIRPAGAMRDEPLLRIASWALAGADPKPIACAVADGVGEFAVQGRNVTFVTVLDWSGRTVTVLDFADDSFQWHGRRGTLRVLLPITSAQSCRWTPRPGRK